MAKMRVLGLCRSVHYKELYLPKAEIEGGFSFMPNPSTLSFPTLVGM